MTSQMFSAIAAVTGQGQNPNTTPAQWGSSQYGYGGSTGGGGGSSSAYHVSADFKVENCGGKEVVFEMLVAPNRTHLTFTQALNK